MSSDDEPDFMAALIEANAVEALAEAAVPQEEEVGTIVPLEAPCVVVGEASWSVTVPEQA